MPEPFRLTIADVFSLSGRPGMSVTGRVESGRVALGDHLVLHAATGPTHVRVDLIQTFREASLEAFDDRATEVSLHLVGVERGQVKSGQVVTSL